MSSNVVRTTGQQVFKYDPPQYTEKGVPVFARNPSSEELREAKGKGEEPKFQFLGEGYYFWDDNIERAHKWGKQHCEGSYRILEAQLELQGDNFLDLVGSREDLRIFLNAFSVMKKKYPNLKIGAFFHGMQAIMKHQTDVWPFTIIRALNVKKNGYKIRYNHLSNAEMLLDPEIIICFYRENELNLQNSRYLDKNNRLWTPKIS